MKKGLRAKFKRNADSSNHSTEQSKDTVNADDQRGERIRFLDNLMDKNQALLNLEEQRKKQEELNDSDLLFEGSLDEDDARSIGSNALTKSSFHSYHSSLMDDKEHFLGNLQEQTEAAVKIQKWIRKKLS